MDDRIFGRVHRIHVEKNARLKAYYESKRDLLTGLINKGYTETYIKKYIDNNPDSQSALIIIDIDNFKLVNDSLGHLFGDEVLKHVAKALKLNTRAGDIVGRIGGDEFVVFVKRYDTKEQITTLTENICQAVSEIYVGEQDKFTLSASCGIAYFPEHGADSVTLTKNADKALFYTKTRSKNGYTVFDSSNADIVNTFGTEDNTTDYTTLGIKVHEYADTFGLELANMAFQLMEDSKDADSTINLLLRKVAEHYNLSIVAIREITDTPQQLAYAYEYMTGDYEVRLGTRWEYDNEPWARFLSHYNNGYYIYDSDKHELTSDTRNIRDEKVPFKTLLEIPIYSNKIFLGSIDFITIERHMNWSDKDISTLKMFCRIVSSYLLNMRAYKKTETLLEQLNCRDSLTGLLKYDYFISKVKEFVSHNNDENTGLAIVYSDIRFFKYVNEVHGYAIGNSLLTLFADTIKNINSRNIAACRVYSDNLVTAVAYDNNRPDEEFADIITAHNHMVEREIQQRFLDNRIVINTGIYIIKTTTNVDVEIAISNANLARKHAKATESKKAVLFSDDMMKNIIQQIELSSSLPTAINNEELTVYYQPKIECGTEKIIGAEALVRWIKPDGSFVFPDQFIPLFESNGLIVEVDYYVYKKVFEHLRHRLDESLPVVPISMNVSRIHLASDDIIDYIKGLFRQYHIPPELVEFELTENIYIENIDSVLPLINEFRNMGIKISMDDFGSGYSSLNALNSLPIDVLKLDRVFMTDTLNDNQKIILTSIIEMAKKLNIAVLCEGVENDSQSKFLSKIGCDMIQGYYYSRPLCEKDFIEYIANHMSESYNYIHFAFDNNLVDESGQYEGRIIGDGITYCNGPAGMSALHFNGGEYACNVVELPKEIYPLSDYTITMWFKEDEEQMWTSLLYTSFTNGFSSIMPHSFDLKAMFRIKDANPINEWTDACSVMAPRHEVWNFISASYNYRTKISRLYINGQPAGVCENVPVLTYPIRILLGGDIYKSSFKGCIADLRIYDQELSPIKILYAFNEGIR